MTSILRSIVLAPAILAAAALAGNVAAAETTLKVPFNFSVAGKSMPAGYYTVQRDSSGNIVSLRGRDAEHSSTGFSRPASPRPTTVASFCASTPMVSRTSFARFSSQRALLRESTRRLCSRWNRSHPVSRAAMKLDPVSSQTRTGEAKRVSATADALFFSAAAAD